MNTDRRSKAIVASGLGMVVVAVVILFLFVLPAVQGTGTPSAAQGPGGAGPGMPGMGGPGGGPPGGMPGMGGPGGMPGMGGPGGGMGMPGPEGAAVPSVSPAFPGATAADLGGQVAAKTPFPLESPRANPFVALPGQRASFTTCATKYGPNWSKIPNTLQRGFTRITYPRDVVMPALPSATTERFARVTGLIWSKGSAMASYETASGHSGIFGPGDIVGDPDEIDRWQVLRIGQDAVTIRNTRTAEEQSLPVRPSDTR